mmetsp:Transcript_7273/g.32790  ORF Transcript_7273/g.32790 Transcript_7273/m.32790 type:complete len:275 (-) Transcript_7273:15-839(-)
MCRDPRVGILRRRAHPGGRVQTRGRRQGWILRVPPRAVLLPLHVHPRAAPLRVHGGHVPLRVLHRQVQAQRAELRERRVGHGVHLALHAHRGHRPGEPTERGDTRGVRSQPRQLPGHLLPVPPPTAVQVHQQGFQLYHPHHRVVDVPDGAHRAETNRPQEPDEDAEGLQDATSERLLGAVLPGGHALGGRHDGGLQEGRVQRGGEGERAGGARHAGELLEGDEERAGVGDAVGAGRDQGRGAPAHPKHGRAGAVRQELQHHQGNPRAVLVGCYL